MSLLSSVHDLSVGFGGLESETQPDGDICMLDDDFRAHLRAQGVKLPAIVRLDPTAIQAFIVTYKDSPHHRSETLDQLRQRAVYSLIWKQHYKRIAARKRLARHGQTLFLASLQILIGIILFLVLSVRGHAQGIDCIYFQNADGSTAKNYCAPFHFKAGTNVTWNAVTGTITINAAGGAGGGTVTTFSAGDMPPLFTTNVANPTTTPALTFTLSNADGYNFLGNNTGSTGAVAYHRIASTMLSDFSTTAPTTTGQIPIYDSGSSTYVPGDPLVQGTQAAGSTTLPNPVVIGGQDYSGTPTVRTAKVDSSGLLYIAPLTFSAPQHVIVDSGSISATQGTSPWVVSNGGTFAVQAAVTVADAADVTLGAKADAANSATDTTPISVMSVLKEMSAKLQAPASTPVTCSNCSGTVTVGGTVTAAQGTATSLKAEVVGPTADNAANPSAKVSTLPAVANAAAPSYTEAHVAPLSLDLAGNLRAISAQPAITATNFTASNSTATVTTVGYSVATVTVHGTYSGVNFAFRFSDDGGTTYYNTTCTRSDANVQETTSGVLADNTSRAWDCSIYGTTRFQVAASAYTSGTAVIGITMIAAQIEAAPTVALATSGNTVAGGGTAGSAATGVITVQGIASMTKLLVTPDSVALPANQSVNTAQINAHTLTECGLNGCAAVGGGTATNVAITDNPLNLGAQAVSSENSAATTARKVQLVADLVGKLITLPYANPENFLTGVTAAITDTTSTAIIASAGGSLRNYVTSCTVTNSHATVGTFVKILDGATIIHEAYAAPAGGGFASTFPVPLRGTAATAVNCQAVTTGANFICSCQGYKGL